VTTETGAQPEQPGILVGVSQRHSARSARRNAAFPPPSTRQPSARLAAEHPRQPTRRAVVPDPAHGRDAARQRHHRRSRTTPFLLFCDRRSAPLLAIEANVEEAFLHCARSFLHAKLWDPQHFVPRDEMPSLARMIGDQLRPSNRPDSDHEQVVEDNERSIANAYRRIY
jgi:hypothetical protein